MKSVVIFFNLLYSPTQTAKISDIKLPTMNHGNSYHFLIQNSLSCSFIQVGGLKNNSNYSQSVLIQCLRLKVNFFERKFTKNEFNFGILFSFCKL